MTLAEDTILENRYRIDRLLASGGMGAIYRGFDTNLKTAVAVKENFFRTPQAIRQFEQEAFILARLRHPNLPRVIQHFSFEGQQYLVMDFIEGQDLWEMVKQEDRSLDERQALTYLSQICQAVSYLHRQTPPIIHRDIKPQNIKITSENQAILVDFGIAKMIRSDERTSSGAQGVTPGYSPPEQYSGMGTNQTSDIYALGATLYAILTGKKPPNSISLMAGGARFERPDLLNPKLSQQVSQTIEWAMQAQQTNRPQTVDIWRQKLDLILTQPAKITPVDSSPVSAWLIGPAGESYPLKPGSLTLGRAKNSDIQVNDPQASRAHAVLEFDGRNFMIYDEGSATGTFINGQRVETDGRSYQPGERLRIGATEFTLSLTPPAPSAIKVTERPIVDDTAATTPPSVTSTPAAPNTPVETAAPPFSKPVTSLRRDPSRTTTAADQARPAPRRTWWVWTAVLGVFFTLLCGGGMCLMMPSGSNNTGVSSQQQTQPEGDQAANNLPGPLAITSETALDLTLTDSLGQPFDLPETLKKQIVVLVFYIGATCSPCMTQLGELEKDYLKFIERGAEVVAVARQDTTGAAQSAENSGATFPILVDPSGSLFEKFGMGKSSPVTPSVFILDHSGQVIWSYISSNQQDRPSNQEVLSHLPPAASNAEFYYRRGFVDFRKSVHDQGLGDFRRAIRLDKNYAQAFAARGYAYLNNGQFNQALRDCQQAIELGPDLPDGYFCRGHIHLHRTEYEQAVADLTQAIDLKFVLHGWAYQGRARAYNALGDERSAAADYKQGIAVYTEAIKRDPTDEIAYNERGFIYVDQEQLNQAFADFDKAISLDPLFANAYFGRGWANYEQEAYDQAIADLTKAIELKHAPLSWPYKLRADAYAGKEDYQNALTDYEEAIRLNPNDSRTYYGRGWVYAVQDDYELALKDFDKAIALNPNFASAYAGRGYTYTRLEQPNYDRAIADYTEAIRLQPNNAYPYNGRGNIYHYQGNYDQAIADYTQAIGLLPDVAVFYSNLAGSYEEKGDKANAIANYQKVLEVSDDAEQIQSARDRLKALGVN